MFDTNVTIVTDTMFLIVILNIVRISSKDEIRGLQADGMIRATITKNMTASMTGMLPFKIPKRTGTKSTIGHNFISQIEDE